MSESKLVFEGLHRVRKWMEACLDSLESATPADEGFRAAWKQLEAQFEDLGPVERLRDRVAPEETGELRAKLEDMSRLHALLTNVVHRRRDEISQTLETTRDLRRQLAFYRSQGGDACDIAG